jgi:hypothetical protein
MLREQREELWISRGKNNYPAAGCKPRIREPNPPDFLLDLPHRSMSHSIDVSELAFPRPIFRLWFQALI